MWKNQGQAPNSGPSVQEQSIFFFSAETSIPISPKEHADIQSKAWCKEM